MDRRRVFVDIAGQRFGRLVALTRNGQDTNGAWLWDCQCDCGRTITTSGSRLRRGRVQSCRCISREMTSQRVKTHGMSLRSEYRIWQGMKERCHNPVSTSYPRYGAQGVVVCERWRDSFENFIADVGPRPSSLHTIDRYPDTKGPYSPDNCRWATRREQQNNLSSNRVITFRGKSMTVAQWGREFGVPRNTIYARLNRGWSVARSLGEPECTI